jgi:hypothetical protein
MPFWDPCREQREWRRQHKTVPLGQLRAMNERDVYSQNPKKRAWFGRYVWRKENLYRVDRPLIIALVMFVVAVAGVTAAYLSWLK